MCFPWFQYRRAFFFCIFNSLFFPTLKIIFKKMMFLKNLSHVTLSQLGIFYNKRSIIQSFYVVGLDPCNHL